MSSPAFDLSDPNVNSYSVVAFTIRETGVNGPCVTLNGHAKYHRDYVELVVNGYGPIAILAFYRGELDMTLYPTADGTPQSTKIEPLPRREE